MPEQFNKHSDTWNITDTIQIRKKRPLLNLGLFIITLITTTIAGSEWVSGTPGPKEFSDIIANGLPYAISILFFLSVHEFGHYFAAKHHGVDVTLPYYIPVPPIPFLNFGTMGAVIKTRSQVPTNKIMFDIGVAGPLAGFVASLIILTYGFHSYYPPRLF
jgi:membrane-associated protease RseP (regulator of RpoE activity)